MTIDQRLDAIKKHLGTTKNTAIAELAEVSKQAVFGWINQGSEPSEKAGKAFEKNTGVRSDYLRFGTGQMLKDGMSVEDLKLEVTQLLEQATPEDRSEDARALMKLLSKYL